MKIIGDKIWDERIQSWNLMLELSIKEYYDLSVDILKNNELQRGRVKSSNTIYSLLKADLAVGCIIPPLVLALSSEWNSKDEFTDIIKENKDNIIILDGLQRSYTIRDLVLDIEKKGDPNKESILNNKIRVEIYLGINKLGVLYRMLTLNSGQTPMSTRHQIEIIYSDYIDKNVIDGVKLIRQTENKTPTKLGEYNFRDIIEGFTSFIDRDYLTLNRNDILDNIKNLEKLSKVNKDDNLFEDYIIALNTLIEKLQKTSWTFNSDKLDKISSPFGKSVITIFNKSQVMTGLGAAMGRLIDFGDFQSIKEIQNKALSKIDGSSIDEAFDELLIKLENVRVSASKIGNDQRMFFYFMFKEYLSPKSDYYLNLLESVNDAYKQYERKTM